MSASPSGLSNGRTPTPNGGPPQFVRKPKAADPLRPRKKPVRRPNGPPRQPVGLGILAPGPSGRPNPLNGTAPARVMGGYQPPANGTYNPHLNGGWTNPPPAAGQYTDFPLFTTKRALREGLRYHIARFASTKKDIDPSNQDDFTRPVVLHRRDPKQPPPGKGIKDEDAVADEPMDSKEREKQEILKAEKEKQKAADLAQIAPTGNNPSALAAKKTQAFRNEKTTQVHRLDKTEEQKKASDLRYEEALPWHLEDADNKNTWVGNYEAALSDTNVIFFIDGDKFRMIPIEKWYKFTPKGLFQHFTIEEAEAKMNKKHKESRWVMKTNEQKEADRAAQDTRKYLHNLYTVKAESNTIKNVGKREVEDMDDLDFDADDLFQDDDEQATVEPDKDEETKDAQDRIKREQLGANIFDKADEAEVEKELEEEKKEAKKRKDLSKGLKKALIKRERNYVYDSDSDHPYSEKSEDDTSDEEKQAEIDRKKDEEAKNKAKAESKLQSGASSKGTNTPSGRPKHTDPLRKPKNLKRPGSPNLSESSGNESSRKKHKNKHTSSSQPTRTSTPIPGSRPMSPAPSASQPAPNQSSRKSSIVKLPVNPSKLSDIQSSPPNPSPAYSPMSDGEATGGEGSDGGPRKKIKIRVKGHNSPTGSRAGSPAPAGSIAGSRAGSPTAPQNIAVPAEAGPTRAKSPAVGPIQPHEIVAALPTTGEGISAGVLMKMFSKRVGEQPNQTTRTGFIQLVKENTKYGPDKLLRRKDS